MKRKILLMFCFTAFCLCGPPAFADMFDFEASLVMTFDGATLNGSLYDFGDVTLNRLDAPIETVVVGPGILTSGDFSLSMDVDNIDNTAHTATGTGEFTLTDIDGDTITGDISGNWGLNVGGYTAFTGDLTNVQWTSDDGFFNGDGGSDDAAVALDLLTSPPWGGQVVELTIDSLQDWVLYTDWGRPKPGTINAVVPTPAAVLLGILGLSAVGIKLRKYA